MLTSLVGVFFGCRHRRMTFPQTEMAGRRPTSGSTHVTCLECGKEFPYDWATMRIAWRPPIEGAARGIEECEKSGVAVRPL